ncbi:MAG: hypothetical protein ACEQSA_05940 [Weeksellaceae bacterium]
MSNNPISILKLQLTEGQQTSSTYSWPLSQQNGTNKWDRIHIRAVSLPFKWFLFNNEPLLWSGGTATLNGNFDSSTIPVALAALFGAVTCTISSSTNIIALTFAAPTTFNISSWSRRARYFLGAGSADIGPALTITFPYPADLGGDDTINFIFQNGLTSENQTGQSVTSSIQVPVPCNPGEYILWEPHDYDLDIKQQMDYGSLQLKICDIWGTPINMNNAQGYIQFELYPLC